MSRYIVFYVILALISSASSCSTKGLFDYRIDVRGTVELITGVAFLEGEPGRVVYLEVNQDRVRVRQPFAAAEGERLVWLTNGPDRAAPSKLFAMVVPEDERETGVTRALIRYDPATGVVDRFITGSEFGALTFSPGGVFAIMYHLPSDGEGSGALFNPNEVAIVNLTEPPSADNPRILSIDIGGRAVSGVEFVPAMEVNGNIRSLVVFFAEAMVKMIDLKDLNVPAIAVKLTADDDPREVEPTQVIARAGDEIRDPMLLVRANGSQDIYAISLVPRPDGQPGFWASLNQFDGGLDPSDMMLVDDGEAPLLIVANSWGSEANVINIDTADTFTLHLEDRAQHILLHGEPGAQEVILFGDETSRVHFVTVSGLAVEHDGNVEDLLIPDGVYLVSVLDENRLLITPSVSEDLLVLDLTTRDITRLTTPGNYVWQDAEVFGDVFFIGNSGSDRVVSLDLGSGHPESLVLDEAVGSFHVLPSPAMGLVLHPTPTGRATLFPLSDPSREAAFIVDGFWLEGFIDDKEVQ